MSQQNSKKRGRRLNVRDQIWQWCFSDPLCIWDPQDKRHEFPLDKLFPGCDRDIEKRNFSLKPGQIRSIIDRTILGYDDRKGFPPGVLPEGFIEPRHQGYEMLAGPRGKWQISVSFFHVDLISPEGVVHHADVTDVMGEEWMTLFRTEISNRYPVIKEEMRLAYERLKVEMGDQAKYFHPSADAAWMRLREEARLPTINFKEARAYLARTFGALETVE
jgi:hypothetical protein